MAHRRSSALLLVLLLALALVVVVGVTLRHAGVSNALRAVTDLPQARLLRANLSADPPQSAGPAATCYAHQPYEDSTGTFTVTGNAFSQVSTYAIPDNDTQITSLTVEAWVTIPNLTITSASRSFSVGFSGATTGTFAQSLNGLQQPWSSSSGTYHRMRPWDVADTGYDASGAGRIRLQGMGSVSVWSANPNQRISVIVHLTGTTRTATPCS